MLFVALAITLGAASVGRADPITSPDLIAPSADDPPSLGAWKRLQVHLAAGKPREEFRLPEASETLDWMIERLQTRVDLLAKGPIRPSTEKFYRYGFRGASPDEEDAYDRAERHYTPKLLSRALSLRHADGPYYTDFMDLTAHFGTAMDLASPEGMRHQYGSRAELIRPIQDEGRAPMPRLYRAMQVPEKDRDPNATSFPDEAQNALFLPTHKQLGYSAFNRVSAYPIYFLALTDHWQRVDNTQFSPADVIGHDCFHLSRTMPSLKTESQIRVAKAFHAAYARRLAAESDPAVRYVMESIWFRQTHESVGDNGRRNVLDAKLFKAVEWLEPVRDGKLSTLPNLANVEARARNAFKSIVRPQLARRGK